MRLALSARSRKVNRDTRKSLTRKRMAMTRSESWLHPIQKIGMKHAQNTVSPIHSRCRGRPGDR